MPWYGGCAVHTEEELPESFEYSDNTGGFEHGKAVQPSTDS